MKRLDTVFSNITIANIVKILEVVNSIQQEENLKFKSFKNNTKVPKKFNISNNNLIIDSHITEEILTFSFLDGFLYWFFKIKK